MQPCNKTGCPVTSKRGSIKNSNARPLASNSRLAKCWKWCLSRSAPLLLAVFQEPGNPDWVSAKEARRISYEAGNRAEPCDAILELARLGFVTGRAVELQAYRQLPTVHEILWEQREWDIEPWFWRDFMRPGKGSLDWDLGKFSASGIGPTNIQSVGLSGVHFHRESLAALHGPIAVQAETDGQQRGRRPQYNWDHACSAVWGRLHRGELMPETQADVEFALIDVLTKGDIAPSESTVRPHAKPIWEEFQKP